MFPDHHQWFPHAVVMPVGLKGMVHYHLVGPPFTSGSSLMMDLDVSEPWLSVPCAPRASFSTTKQKGCADELFWGCQLNVPAPVQPPTPSPGGWLLSFALLANLLHSAHCIPRCLQAAWDEQLPPPCTA